MLKNSLIMLMLCAGLSACHQSATNQNADDSAKTTADTGLKQPILGDTLAKSPASTDSVEPKTTTADKLIVPGRSIGKMQLSEDVANVSELLGRPDSADAAMGSSLMVWFTQQHKSSGYRVSVFAHRKMGTKDEIISRIQKILVNDPRYKTAEGYGAGTTLDDIKKSYDLKPTSTYDSKNGKVQVYTDLDKGISFEIDKTNTCVGVVVHQLHDTAAAYLNMH